MKSLRRWAAPLLAAVLLAACGVGASPSPASTTATFPLTVTDDLGRAVTLSSAPARIVSLSGAHTETLFALGVADRVVAVDPYSDYPADAKSKPKIGFSQLKPNVEQIVSLNPDLVVTHVEKQDFLQQMEARNIKTLKLEPKDFDGIWKDMKILGQVTGREARAEELVRGLQQRLRKVADTVKSAKRPRVYYELDATDPGKPFTVGPGSFVDAIIVAAGGANIGSGLKKAFDQISTEEVVRQDPEIILLADANVPYNPVKPEDVGKRPGWSALAAVRQQKVRPIDGSIASRPGPRIVDAVENVAREIHPELFPKALSVAA
jgi:iron complex transport system substrate-binding protein